MFNFSDLVCLVFSASRDLLSLSSRSCVCFFLSQAWNASSDSSTLLRRPRLSISRERSRLLVETFLPVPYPPLDTELSCRDREESLVLCEEAEETA